MKIIIIIIVSVGGGRCSSSSSSLSCSSSTPSSCSTNVFHVNHELIVTDTNIYDVINSSSSVEPKSE